MTQANIFFNRAGRLRSGWRFLAFAAAFVVAAAFVQYALVYSIRALLAAGVPKAFFTSGVRTVIQSVATLALATLLGWACNRLLEGLPPRALGWKLHDGWGRHLGVGALYGVLSLAFAALVCTAAGSYTFALTPTSLWGSVLETLVTSAWVFLIGAAGEEALSRGYPLQTLLRSWPAWLAIVPASLAFASLHVFNPNVTMLSLANTLLAGLWLSIAYVRTRSLWFPLGIHWGWNFAAGSLLGIPVSGLTELAPVPLMRATDIGPTWLSGGHYGVEGGAACTAAIIISTFFVRYTRLVKPDEELKRMTDGESPATPAAPEERGAEQGVQTGAPSDAPDAGS